MSTILLQVNIVMVVVLSESFQPLTCGGLHWQMRAKSRMQGYEIVVVDGDNKTRKRIFIMMLPVVRECEDNERDY